MGSMCINVKHYFIIGDITVSETVTITSDLNGANPQFTLTCISTGGPATTVTWTRDSVNVTEGNETVLDDPVTAQYTHTLTVTGLLPGLYTCTVENDKPSNDSANITVQGIELHLTCYWTFTLYIIIFIYIYTYSYLTSQWCDSSPGWSH